VGVGKFLASFFHEKKEKGRRKEKEEGKGRGEEKPESLGWQRCPSSSQTSKGRGEKGKREEEGRKALGDLFDLFRCAGTACTHFRAKGKKKEGGEGERVVLLSYSLWSTASSCS